jgi:predicted transcriptional regulator YdeE
VVLKAISTVAVTLFLVVCPAVHAEESGPAKAPRDYVIGEIRVQTLAGFEFLYVSKEITHDQIPAAIGELVGKAMGAMKEAGITSSELPTASLICIYRDAVKVGERFTLEAGFMVPPGTKAAGEAKVKTIEPWPCAAVVYSGGIPRLAEAIAKLGREMERAGLKPDGEYREYYVYWEGVESPNNIMLIGFGIADEVGKRTAEETEVKPEAQIVEKEAFLVAGVRYEGENKQGEIGELWDKGFLPRMGELAAITTDPHGAYGVARALPGIEPGPFEYLAGMAVKSIEKLPEGMVGWSIPAHTYAVFRANGVADLGRVIGYVYGEWLPKSGYEMAGDFTFEYYPETFPVDSVIHVYFPVRRK